MLRRLTCIFVSVLILIQTGCGTTLVVIGPAFHLRQPDNMVYSGVRVDANAGNAVMGVARDSGSYGMTAAAGALKQPVTIPVTVFARTDSATPPPQV
jgi:hypothetical protein